MGYFPIQLQLTGRPVVVVGGGEVAARKSRSVLASGGRVKAIASHFADVMRQLRSHEHFCMVERDYQAGDLAGAFLAFAATDDREINQQVALEAVSRGILCSVADAPEQGGFISPAVVERGDLVITVSTNGRVPALAARIRDEIAGRYGDGYGRAVELLANVREKLLTSRNDRKYNKKILNELAAGDLPQLLENNAAEAINHLLLELLGPEFTLDRLMVDKKDSP